MTGVLLLSLTAVAHSWELSQPVIDRRDTLYVIEHQFSSTLPPDSLLALLYNPTDLVKLNEDRPGELEILPVQGESYDVVARYEFLWFYENRMVLRRKLLKDQHRVTSELVGFEQTFGVAPEPLYSVAWYEVTPGPGGGSIVHFRQRTAFEEKLGRLANRTFSKATVEFLLTVETYVHTHEPDLPLFAETR